MIDHRTVADGSACMLGWEAALQDIVTASPLLDNYNQLRRDPWGSPYLLDENEGEFAGNPCIRDTLRSVGPDGIQATADDLVSVFPFKRSACQ